MQTFATQLAILQMTGNAVCLLEESKESATTMDQMILTAEECTMEARWEASEVKPDTEEQLAMLVRAAANCIRAAATLVEKIDPATFVELQIQLSPGKPTAETADVPMPPVLDFVENVKDPISRN